MTELTTPWYLNGNYLAIVTWVGAVVTIIGFLFTLWGLRLTFNQAREAQKAAKRAVRLLESRINLGTIAFSYAQIELLRGLIQDNSLRAASMIFHNFKREVTEICHLLRDRQELAGQIITTRENLSKLQTFLDNAPLESPKTKSMMKALKGISEFLSLREQELKYHSGDTGEVG